MCQQRTSTAVQQRALDLDALFDHEIGAQMERRRELQAERPGGAEVDRKRKFRWLQHGQVGTGRSWLAHFQRVVARCVGASPRRLWHYSQHISQDLGGDRDQAA